MICESRAEPVHHHYRPGNTNILDGEAEDLLKECAEYERKIEEAGGIDLFLGGMGEDGHLAFNEVRVG